MRHDSEVYSEYKLIEEPDGFHLYLNGWSCGYVFKSRKRAEQALTALNNAVALDYANA